ncbi:hypothetical protein [Bacillus sp. M6-12]|nr:hypothetical protein [Bacillus sp. M6-12]
MKKEDEKTSEGLNQIFEIINAHGDIGEMREIVQRSDDETKNKDE